MNIIAKKIFGKLKYHHLTDMLPDRIYLSLLYSYKFDKKLDWKNPVSFNEKINYLKLYDRKSAYTSMVDKYEAKSFVASILGDGFIVPNYGVWDSFEEINFDQLPDQFVLKCTHDSGGLVICRDKSKLDFEAAREKINKSLAQNYYYLCREWPYKNVKPRIIAEEFLSEVADKGVTDYKFFCFNGKPKFIYVSRGLEKHETAQISFFDMKGNKLPFVRSDYSPIDSFERPENFDDMIGIAEKLAHASDSPFIRVDLYDINQRTYFSELTFSPCGGYIPFSPASADEQIGKILDISGV